MSGGYAPASLHQLYDAIKLPSKVLSGILGDDTHFRDGGYHVPRAYCSSGDYSVQLPADRLGSPYAASALDVGLDAGDLRLAIDRLIAAGRANDPRVHGMRECFGSADGVRVIGWDRHNPDDAHDDTTTTSDQSHTWHLHVSVYRMWADTFAAIAGIASVINGTGISEGDEFELSSAEYDELHRQLDLVLNGRPEDPKKPGVQHLEGLVQIQSRFVDVDAQLAGMKAQLAVIVEAVTPPPPATSAKPSTRAAKS